MSTPPARTYDIVLTFTLTCRGVCFHSVVAFTLVCRVTYCCSFYANLLCPASYQVYAFVLLYQVAFTHTLCYTWYAVAAFALTLSCFPTRYRW